MHLTELEQQDRRVNPLIYDNEPTISISSLRTAHDIKLGQGSLCTVPCIISMATLLRAVQDGRSFSDYNIPPEYVVGPQGDTVDAVTPAISCASNGQQNQWLESESGIRTRQKENTIGGSFYYFDSTLGQLSGQRDYNKITPRHRYYEYFGKKYLRRSLPRRTTGWVTAEPDVNLQSAIRPTILIRKIGAFAGYNYRVNWNFLSPRLGSLMQSTIK